MTQSRVYQIIVDASNGASEYGNKFGEPITQGFARSFGLDLGGEEGRREWIKPIMFTGGMGSMDKKHRWQHCHCCHAHTCKPVTVTVNILTVTNPHSSPLSL